MKILFPVLSLSFFSLFFLACGADEERPPLPEAIDVRLDEGQVWISQQQFDASDMELGAPMETVFPYSLQVNGFIDVPPMSKAVVNAYYGGYVKGLNLLPGQWIRKGQVLFTLESPEFVEMQQAYLEAHAQLAYLQSDFERQQTLAAENIASQKNFLKAESDFRVQQARMEGLRKKLEMLGIDLDRVGARDFVAAVTIYAPISGYVTEVNANSGSFLNASATALEIVSTDHLHLELEVFEKDIHQLREDQLIKFRVPGSTAEPYLARVHLIGSMVEAENRVVRVHGHLQDEAGAKGLLPGMYIEALIETEVDSVLALPEAAVVRTENNAYILVQQNQASKTKTYIFERQLVHPGRIVDGMVEIKDDLSALKGPVLVKGGFNLIMEE